MAKKNKKSVEDPFLTETDERIIERNAEDILGDCFGRYSKAIIQDRAIPDGRDGLKPVQRRILYYMHKTGNTYNKVHHKSAKTVGGVLGSLHPHGDSSVYDAMVRMSQDWKITTPLVDVQGNNGSIDDDPPAASRYCVSGDTEVVTDKGLVKIEDIIKNSELDSEYDIDITVQGYNGDKLHASKFFNSGIHPVYKVTVAGGDTITGTLNHPILILDNEMSIKWSTIEDLKIGDFCLISDMPEVAEKIVDDKPRYHAVRIHNIEYAGKQPVYSIRVDSECHSFVANRFINHNTEARLSHMADFMLKDIDKDTVKWVPNYSDEEMEPTVLPARFPNLLINGINGIASGYATSIPPHNLNEVVNATIHRIKHPDSTLDDLMQYIQGPDFPTGGIVMGIDGIKQAFTTGKGKVIVRAKAEQIKNQIIITEIPYEVVKQNLVKKIEDFRIDKKLAGVTEVRDESGRAGLRIVLDLKKDAPVESILNYLYKNTELQVSYNYNMVAIVDKAPVQLGIVKALDTFIKHRTEVVTRRSIFEKNKKEARQHILDGLIKALSILDEVVKTIRASKNKADAKVNLIDKFYFTEKQAEAIVMMQLYKLTNTDVVELKEEHARLAIEIAELVKILNDPEELKRVMIEELEEVNKEFPTPRRSVIEGAVRDIVIDEQAMIPSETVQVAITRDGYVKRVSNRSYGASGETLARHKDGDIVVGQAECNTRDSLIFFTDTGYYGKMPIYKLKESKWKDLGDHIDSYIKTGKDDKIIGGVIVKESEPDQTVVMMTTNNRIKQVKASDFNITRQSKVSKAISLRDGDTLKFVASAKNANNTLFVTTKNGKGNAIDMSKLPPVSTIHGGVTGTKVADGDEVVAITANPESTLALISKYGQIKIVDKDVYATQSRIGSGKRIIKQGNEIAYVTGIDEIVTVGSLENHYLQHDMEPSKVTTGFANVKEADSEPIEFVTYM